MPRITLSTLLLLLCSIAIFSEQKKGVVDRNIIFTTYKDGKTEDLHKLLNSGKHVYVLSYKYPG